MLKLKVLVVFHDISPFDPLPPAAILSGKKLTKSVRKCSKIHANSKNFAGVGKPPDPPLFRYPLIPCSPMVVLFVPPESSRYIIHGTQKKLKHFRFPPDQNHSYAVGYRQCDQSYVFT